MREQDEAIRVQSTAEPEWVVMEALFIAAHKWGEFATVGIIPPKRKLHINLKTLRGGGVLVEARKTGAKVPRKK